MPVLPSLPTQIPPIATLLIIDQDGRPVSNAEQMNFLAQVPRVINGKLVYPPDVVESEPNGQQQ